MAAKDEKTLVEENRLWKCAIEVIRQSQHDDPNEIRSLDLETCIKRMAVLLGKERIDDDVLLVLKQTLLKLADEYKLAADLVESFRGLDEI